MNPFLSARIWRGASAWACVAPTALICVGCATFAKHDLPDVRQIVKETGEAAPPDATYAFAWETDLGGKRRAEQSLLAIADKEFADAINEVGLIALRRGMQGEIHIDARMRNHGSAGAAAAAGVIAGLSLCTIPVWATDGYQLRATVTTKTGRTVEYDLNDAMTTVIWLPFIVLTPFKSPEAVGLQVRTNMFKTLIVKMQEDGLLAVANAEESGRGARAEDARRRASSLRSISAAGQ